MADNLAELILEEIFSDARIKSAVPLEHIYAVAKIKGIRKKDLKAARKKLGILSVESKGVRYWTRPEKEWENA